MTLVKWKNKQASAMPSLFNDFFDGFFNDSMVGRDYFKSVPAVNISEQADQFKIEVAAPGFNKGDFKVNVNSDASGEVLTITAEKRDEKKSEDGTSAMADSRYTRKEFAYTSFERRFTMPDHVEADKIGAEYKDGVLALTLPKMEKAKQKPAREITIS